MSDEALCFHRALFWAVAIAFRSAAFSCELNIEEGMPAAAGVVAIPASVVNGQLVSGAQPNARFTSMMG
jgi:predicted DsbA family dithiol-disulfide isomerase